MSSVLRAAGMTYLQQCVLQYIMEHTDRHGISPSMREIMSGAGLTSTSHVHRAVLDLEERGFLSRRNNRARSIEVAGQAVVLPASVGRALRQESLKRCVAPSELAATLIAGALEGRA